VTDNLKPICVDLDGTLIRNDITVEAIKIFIKRRFGNIFKTILWFLRGRAYLKKKLASKVDIDIDSLDYNQEFLSFIMEKRNEGHRIFLATACDHVYAYKIADHLQMFDGVFSSNGEINLRAESKANTLAAIFGDRGFIYAGNSKDDIHVWNKSAECILVNPTKSVLHAMKNKKYLLFKDSVV
jgi:hydroxymethylpyrimidine pyrophosphatase-like HAD family hydrolase